MILETVVFTALPTARASNSLSLSCFIAPQLGGIEGNPSRLPLSRYADFANGAWATTVRQMAWNVVLRYSVDDSDEVSYPAVRISPDPDVDLFQLLFPDTMPVDPFTFANPSNRQMLSFPIARLSQALDNLQRAVVQESPETRPEKITLVSPYEKNGEPPRNRLPLDPFVLTPERRAALGRTIDKQLKEGGVTRAPDPQGSDATALAVEMLNRMLAPQATPEQMRTPPKWPDLDFHQALSLLTSHPNLLRKLGFIVDLRVDTGGRTLRTGAIRTYVGTSWPGSYDPDQRGVDITTAFPRVATRLSGTIFRPRAATTLLDEGFVDVGGLTGVTSEVEIETQATQTQATAISRAQHEDRQAFGTPDRAGLPARHSSGVAIVKTDFAAALRDVMKRQNANWSLLLTGDEVLIDAQDVLAGYRLDVRRTGQSTWRTLHRRHGVLTPYAGRSARPTVDLGDDENWVEPATSSHVDDATAPLRLAETIARWTGWSLAFPPPGKMLDENSQAADPAGPSDGWAVIDSLHGTVAYGAPASGAQLPTLRFSSTTYEFRLRWVDMAGNSVAVSATGGPVVKVPYLRQDPVPAPGVYLAADPVWGESVDVVIVRTAASPPYSRKASSRYVAPPSASAALAMAHGMFDDASGVPRPDAYETIATRESAALPGQQLPANPGVVPYLADPLARGLFLRGVPKAGATYDGEFSLGYGGSWPDMRVVEIVVDGTMSPGASVKNGKIVVGIAAGRVAHLRLSHSLDPAGLQLMDLWRRAGSAAQQGRAAAGAWWALTPDRTVVVVHASQQPVMPPAFVIVGSPLQLWKATRVANETAATLRGKINVDTPSTESITLTAVTTTFVDNGPGTGTPYVAIDRDAGALGTVAVEDPAPGGAAQNVLTQVRAPFLDTRHTLATVSAVATSRFAEYFRRDQSFTASNSPVVVAGGTGVVAGSARVTYQPTPGSRAVTATDKQYAFDDETGTFRRLSMGLLEKQQIPLGATVTVSFVPDPITRHSRETASVPRRAVTLDVPSSARPLPPDVVQVLPIFRWGGPSGSPVGSMRYGGGLRIYLGRPWGSSGIGEDLALLLRPAQAGAADLPLDDLVSRWGQDPALRGVQPPGGYQRAEFPRPTHFLNKTRAITGVGLAEFNATVEAALYTVGAYDATTGAVSGYDAARDLWFVDIEINQAAAYRPFLQLALARYQAQSVPGLELSPVTVVDVVQLEPDRLMTVAITDAAINSTVNVTMTGRTYIANELGRGPGDAFLILERYVGPSTGANTSNSGAWEHVSSTKMSGQLDEPNIGTWTGRVFAPANRTRGEYRVVVEQYETLRTDGLAKLTSGLTAAERTQATGRRLVHQDLLVLPTVGKPKP